MQLTAHSLSRPDPTQLHQALAALAFTRTLFYESLSGSMQAQGCLLVLVLDRHKAHARPRHRLADGRRVGVIVDWAAGFSGAV